MTPESIACRECHRKDHHKMSCSHVRYEGRLAVVPQDEVAVPHEPAQPYCPGPDVACHYGPSDYVGTCSYSDGPCYYGTQTYADWAAEHGAVVALRETGLSAEDIRSVLRAWSV